MRPHRICFPRGFTAAPPSPSFGRGGGRTRALHLVNENSSPVEQFRAVLDGCDRRLRFPLESRGSAQARPLLLQTAQRPRPWAHSETMGFIIIIKRKRSDRKRVCPIACVGWRRRWARGGQQPCPPPGGWSPPEEPPPKAPRAARAAAELVGRARWRRPRRSREGRAAGRLGCGTSLAVGAAPPRFPALGLRRRGRAPSRRPRRGDRRRGGGRWRAGRGRGQGGRRSKTRRGRRRRRRWRPRGPTTKARPLPRAKTGGGS